MARATIEGVRILALVEDLGRDQLPAELLRRSIRMGAAASGDERGPKRANGTSARCFQKNTATKISSQTKVTKCQYSAHRRKGNAEDVRFRNSCSASSFSAPRPIST